MDTIAGSRATASTLRSWANARCDQSAHAAWGEVLGCTLVTHRCRQGKLHVGTPNQTSLRHTPMDIGPDPALLQRLTQLRPHTAGRSTATSSVPSARSALVPRTAPRTTTTPDGHRKRSWSSAARTSRWSATGTLRITEAVRGSLTVSEHVILGWSSDRTPKSGIGDLPDGRPGS